MSQKALNRVLALNPSGGGPELLISSGIIDLQNNWFCEQFKHCKFRISVPMSHISFWLYRAPWLQSASGRQQIQEKRNLRIQGHMHFFRKMSQKALNRVWHWNPVVEILSFWFLPEILIYKTTGFVNNSNTANLEFRSQCRIFRFGYYISFRFCRPQGSFVP